MYQQSIRILTYQTYQNGFKIHQTLLSDGPKMNNKQ